MHTPATPPLIVVTNDDGIDAPGLALLERIAARHGEVLTVAPRTERSGISHGITLHAPLRIVERGAGRYAVQEGTPADCIYVALHLLAGRGPSLVVSGINHGLNIGHDVIFSGTVAAARQAVIHGIPAVAFSYEVGDSAPIDAAAPHVEAVLEAIWRHGVPPGVLLNVNVPNPGIEPVQGYAVTRLGRRIYRSRIVQRVDPRGAAYIWIGAGDVEMDCPPGSDCHAVRHGKVSITPLGLDTTATESIETLRQWSIVRSSQAA